MKGKLDKIQIMKLHCESQVIFLFNRFFIQLRERGEQQLLDLTLLKSNCKERIQKYVSEKPGGILSHGSISVWNGLQYVNVILEMLYY